MDTYLTSDDVEEQHSTNSADRHHVPRWSLPILFIVAARHDLLGLQTGSPFVRNASL